jgi:hypothetical protein
VRPELVATAAYIFEEYFDTGIYEGDFAEAAG